MQTILKLPSLYVSWVSYNLEHGSNTYMSVISRDSTNTLSKWVKPNVIMVPEEQETYTRHDQYNSFKGNIDKYCSINPTIRGDRDWNEHYVCHPFYFLTYTMYCDHKQFDVQFPAGISVTMFPEPKKVVQQNNVLSLCMLLSLCGPRASTKAIGPI